MAYNISRLILTCLEYNHGLKDEKVERKYKKELEVRKKKAADVGGIEDPIAIVFFRPGSIRSITSSSKAWL